MKTSTKDALRAETVFIPGHGGDEIEAYLAQSLAEGSHGSVVVLHHMPGYDEGTKEIARRFASQGYIAVVPNLYSREAPDKSPEEASRIAREQGGVPDERLVGDVDGAASFAKSLDSSNGKVAVIGYCSGGRQAFLAACSLDLDAAVDCYGGFVVKTPPAEMPLHVKPVADKAKDLSCPLLGLFGAEDAFPAPDEVADLDRILTEAGKEHDFHTFEGAGHGFFGADGDMFRPAAAREGWSIIWDFFHRHLE